MHYNMVFETNGANQNRAKSNDRSFELNLEPFVRTARVCSTGGVARCSVLNFADKSAGWLAPSLVIQTKL